MKSQVVPAAGDDFDRLLAARKAVLPDAEQILLERSAEVGAALEVARIRSTLNLTQRQLAEAAGIQPSVISHYEQPTYKGHKIATLARLAGAVGWELHLRFAPKGEAQWFDRATAIRAEMRLTMYQATFTLDVPSNVTTPTQTTT